MSAQEIAWGWVPGGFTGPGAPRRSRLSPLAALEEAVLPGLCRPPCVVHFSGGRDSSLVLAVAVGLARREGLDEPVAYTRRYPAVADAQESEWQELVVRHLGVRRWERRTITSEGDLVGPVAAASLRRHGVVWPPMLHTQIPDIQVAQGGSVLSGEGGDEVFGPNRLSTLRALARRRVRPSARNLVMGALGLAPGVVRRTAARRVVDSRLPTPWLRPAARQELLSAIARDEATEPLHWRTAVRRHCGRRGVWLASQTMEAFAAEQDVLSIDPLLSHGFLAAFTTAGGVLGPIDRTDALQRFFGDVLPPEVLNRRSKATFNGAAWSEHTVAFVERFDGSGVDPDLVDVQALLEAWSEPQSNALSYALLQACWLATEGR